MNFRTPLKYLYWTMLGKSGLVVMVIFGLAVGGVFWHESLKPRYQGKTMEDWLNDFSAANNGMINSNTNLSPQQKNTLKAFQHFGKDGFDYLTKQLHQKPTTYHKTLAYLYQYQWFRDLELPLGNPRAAGAYVLIKHLKVPYDWVEPHWTSSDTPSFTTDYFKLTLITAVTNPPSQLVPEVANYLTHTNQFIRQIALPALNACYKPGKYHPEIESHLAGLGPSHWSMRTYLEILSKHARSSAWAQQELSDAADQSDSSISAMAIIMMTNSPALRSNAMSKIKELIEKSIQRAEQHPNAILSIPWLEAFETGNVKLDDSLKPLFHELAQHAFQRDFFQIIDILEKHSWEIDDSVVSLVRQRMQSIDYMGYYQFQALLWLLDRAPEDPETWATFDRIMEKEKPINVPNNIRWLAELAYPSKAAEERLKTYAMSNQERTKLAAEETLAELRNKGLLTNEKINQ